MPKPEHDNVRAQNQKQTTSYETRTRQQNRKIRKKKRELNDKLEDICQVLKDMNVDEDIRKAIARNEAKDKRSGHSPARIPSLKV